MEAIRPTLEEQGATILVAGFPFGEYDVLIVYEAPDDLTAASVAMAVGAVRVRSSRPRPRDCSAGRNGSSLCANAGLSPPGKCASRTTVSINRRNPYRTAADPRVQSGSSPSTVRHRAASRSAHAAWRACGASKGQDHSGGPGIIEANEQITFPPLPCDRYPSTGHPLPDLPPHRRVPAGQPQ